MFDFWCVKLFWWTDWGCGGAGGSLDVGLDAVRQLFWIEQAGWLAVRGDAIPSAHIRNRSCWLVAEADRDARDAKVCRLIL